MYTFVFAARSQAIHGYKMKIRRMSVFQVDLSLHEGLAQSTPQANRFMATDFNSYVTRQIATGALRRHEGGFTASDRPGLGVEPITAALGKPVLAFE